MTVRVTRRFSVDVPCDDIWTFISDPEKRADAISVVSGFELGDPTGRTATWLIDLPIPLVTRTVRVETEDVVREPPEYVKFVGRSPVMRVVGEHRLERTENGCSVTNEFVVEGRLPGVERYFKRNLDRELKNLEAAMRAEFGRAT